MRKELVKILFCSFLVAASGICTEVYAIKYINGKKYFSYMVQAGESIQNLTNAFRVSEADLLEQNQEAKTKGLREGMIILIPVKESMINSDLPEISIITYKVKPGDTLFSLAKNNNTTIEDIIQRNVDALSDGILRAGSIIKIAKNSGGLTGGEEAKRKKAKEEKETKPIVKPAQMSAADSIQHVRTAYWTQPWTIINVTTPGSINTQKKEGDWRMISRLKVTGHINQTDVSVVGKRIFEFDKITALDMHEVVGMTKIGTKDFEECRSLKALSLPNTIDSIGAGAFSGSGNLEVLRCYAITPPACGIHSFENVNQKECELVVPQNAIDNYKSAKYWINFENIKAIPTAATK